MGKAALFYTMTAPSTAATAMIAPPIAKLDPNDVAPFERLPEAPVGAEEEDELETEAPLGLGAGV